MFKDVFIPEDNGWYRIEMSIANRVIFLLNQVKVLKASNEHERADVIQDRVYDIMDKALHEHNAYAIEEKGAA